MTIALIQDLGGGAASRTVLADYGVVLALRRRGLQFDLGTYLRLDHVPSDVLRDVYPLLRTDASFLDALTPALDPSYFDFLCGRVRRLPPWARAQVEAPIARRFVRCVRYVPALIGIGAFRAFLRRHPVSVRAFQALLDRMQYDPLRALLRNAAVLPDATPTPTDASMIPNV